MMFLLGFFSGVFFLIGASFIYSYKNRVRRQMEADFQREKDELLIKALPVYSQVTKIFKKEDIAPQKIASLMFVAKIIEDSLEQEIAKKPLNQKVQ